MLSIKTISRPVRPLVATRRRTTCLLKKNLSKDDFKKFRHLVMDSRKKDINVVSEKLDDIGRKEAEQFVSLMNMHVDFIKDVFDLEENKEETTQIEIIEAEFPNENNTNDEYFEK